MGAALREGESAPLGRQGRAERRTKERTGSPGSKEAHRPARSRLRQLRAYGEPRTLGSRPYVVFYAAFHRSVYLVYGGVGQRSAGGHQAMMRPLQSSIS